MKKKYSSNECNIVDLIYYIITQVCFRFVKYSLMQNVTSLKGVKEDVNISLIIIIKKSN